MRTLARQREVIVFIAIHDLNQALRFADQVLVIAEGTAQGSGCFEVIASKMLRNVYKVEAQIKNSAVADCITYLSTISFNVGCAASHDFSSGEKNRTRRVG